jgi:DNA-binding SARP family transcriptional activator
VRTLRVLGGLWLDDDDSRPSGRGAQRRRLALLTLVALSPGKRVTRDKAIATLWPENTSAEGRRRLSSAVYDLRTLLGGDVIESAGDELRIADSAGLRTDVEEFESALARGDAEEALAAYGGPLLDGVHLSGAAEFEVWIATQRERLRRLYMQALEQAAEARVSRGESTAAVSAVLHLVELEPLSGRAALVAVNTLVAVGDRPQALRVADAHESRVWRELGVAPDSAIVDVTRRLRTAAGVPSTASIAASAQPTSSGDHLELTRPEGEPLAEVGSIIPRERQFISRLLRGGATAAIVLAAVAGAAYRSRASAGKRDSAPTLNAAGLSAAAARSTTSPAALQAFVDGEMAYAHGRYDSAVKSFRAAVARDSTFALAHLRLSESLLWQEQPDMIAAMHDSLALRWSSNLPDEERLLIRAYAAWHRGEYAVADSLDRILMRDPSNPEAQFQLGEVLFHYNPMRGRSIGEAGPWFNNAVLLDSPNWGARWHLLLLDAVRVSPSAFHDEVTRLLAAQPDGQASAELRLFAADLGELPRVAATASGGMLFDAAWRRAVFRRDLLGAETLLTAMTDARRSEYERTTASYAIAALRFARGRGDAATSFLDPRAATQLAGGNAWVLLVHGIIVNGPGQSVRLDTLSDAIERWRQTLAGFGQPTHVPDVIARYLVGLLAADRGDTLEAMRAAAELDDIARRRDPYLPRDLRRARDLAQTIRAYRDLRGGRCDRALRALDTETSEYWLGIIASSPLAAQSFERYVRAECLLSLGRNAEAVSWFETFEQNALYDLELLGPALRGQAAAHRALGEMEAAAEIERRLERLRS